MSLYLEAVSSLGIGSLHPGGFSHTLNILKKISLLPEDSVLEIGCGSGRTACQIAKAFGARVFALDNSENMLAKAKTRARQEAVEIELILGDALNLPFRDEVFNLIFIESVLIFIPARDALKECFRVLKRDGILVNVELISNNSLPLIAGEQLSSICGLQKIPELKDWLNDFSSAGFSQIEVKQSRLPGILENLKEILFFKDFRQTATREKTGGELKKTLWQYRKLVIRNYRHLGFGTFIMRKG